MSVASWTTVVSIKYTRIEPDNHLQLMFTILSRLILYIRQIRKEREVKTSEDAKFSSSDKKRTTLLLMHLQATDLSSNVCKYTVCLSTSLRVIKTFDRQNATSWLGWCFLILILKRSPSDCGPRIACEEEGYRIESYMSIISEDLGLQLPRVNEYAAKCKRVYPKLL